MGRTKKIAVICFISFLLYISFQYAKAYVYYLDLQNDLLAIQGQCLVLEEEEKELQELLTYVGSLSYVEKIAREELSLVKEGETLLILIEETN